jgi:putative hemolysin
MDLALLFLLILINGFFSMAEMAVVSSRRARLQRLADDGSPGAESALSLHEEPSTFLSAIQVGITSVGILSGAIGETVLADPLAARLAALPLLEP